MIAWRITKSRYAPYDATGAMLVGARWSSAGREVIYASDTFAGAILERLDHALRPRTLPGPHHAVRIDIPDGCIETLAAEDLPGWDARDSPPHWPSVIAGWTRSDPPCSSFPLCPAAPSARP